MNKIKSFETRSAPSFKNKNNDGDDEDCDFKGGKHLGYFTQVNQSTCITVPVDEPIREAAYYRQCAQAIANASPDDRIEFNISSPGGLLEGLVMLLTAMAKTEAVTIANIDGECHSAASMLALNCDNVQISPYASMLVHFVSYGASGKASDVRSHVNHIHNTNEKLFRETYKYFLTEEEIEKCINGYELWLDYEAIIERMEQKYKLVKETNLKEQLEEQDAEEVEEVVVQSTSAPKKKK